MDFVIWITHSLREGFGELARLKTCIATSRISSIQRWRLGGIYSPLEKTSHFIVVAIPDMFGMTYTTPTVTELQ